MGYYEPDTGYYEPSAADIFFDEIKDKFREYLTDDVKYELERLTKENENLKDRNSKLSDENYKLNVEKRNAEWSKESIRKEVENEFYSKAIDEVFAPYIENVDVYYAENIPHEQPKCELCDNERSLVHEFPNHKIAKTACDCSKLIYYYEPKIATVGTLQYRVKPSRYNSERKYYVDKYKVYNPDSRYDDYGYADFKILHIVDVFDDDTIDLRNTLSYGEKIGFKTEEECQKYCNWLNDKE